MLKMKIDFNETLKTRTIAFCKDELNYHINQSGCADEYHDETCAEIELLFHLGEKPAAKEFKKQYLGAISEQISSEEDPELKKNLRELKSGFREFWTALTA